MGARRPRKLEEKDRRGEAERYKKACNKQRNKMMCMRLDIAEVDEI
jgi:hypothetical protein